VANQNTNKTHCKNGHAFTEENTVVKVQNGIEHRQCYQCHKDSQNRRARLDKQNPVRWEKLRARRRKGQLKRVGWTIERFEDKWKEHEGRCEICNREISREIESHHTDKAYADHEHVEPPNPRGLLCVNCNIGLGNFQDSPELMQAAIAYVNKYSGGKPSGPQSLSS
jgi:Recombination endonuclease VII